MKHRWLPSVVLSPLVVVALVVSSSACGTLMNFTGGPHNDSWETPRPYGGVYSNLHVLRWENAHKLKAEDIAIVAPLLLLDLGVSAVLDTATLPIVLWLNLENLFKKKPEPIDPNVLPSMPPDLTSGLKTASSEAGKP